MSSSADIAAQLQSALTLHQNGKIADAAIVYRAILTKVPDHFDALHLLGVTEFQQGNTEGAVNFFDQAIENNKTHPTVYFNRGIALHQLGRLEDALASYDAALKLKPDYLDARCKRALVLSTLNLNEQALAEYAAILAIAPQHTDTLCNYGNILQILGRYEESLKSYDRLLAIKPLDASIFFNKANALRTLERHDEAISNYQKALEVQPDFVDAMFNCTRSWIALEKLDDALAAFDKIISLVPTHLNALLDRGTLLQKMGRMDEALLAYEHVLSIDADHKMTLTNLGGLYFEQDEFKKAKDCYDRILAIDPTEATAYLNRGVVLEKLECVDESLVNYQRAIELNPEYTDALFNYAYLLQRQKDFVGALEAYKKLLDVKPDYIPALDGCAFILHSMARYDEALAFSESALEYDPDNANVYSNRGNILFDLKRGSDALESYERALEIESTHKDALINHARVASALDRNDQALISYNKLLVQDKHMDFLLGNRLHLKMQMCDWDNFEQDLADLEEGVRAGKLVAPPFALIGLGFNLDDQKKLAQLYVDQHVPLSKKILPPVWPYQHEKIRVGYFSADFLNHATAHLMVELFEKHDKSQFEWYAFSLNKPVKDEMRGRLELAFDHFIDVHDKTDIEVAALVRELEIDIAVDLKGFTQDCRTGIFAERVAPIQINYLGYPGTMGAEYIDYIIADPIIIPPSDQRYYTEMVAYLPYTYQANTSVRYVLDEKSVVTRKHFGLPEDGFVFCCFNNNYKITPIVFDCWMRILKRVPNSVLWLFVNNKEAKENLIKEAKKRGVSEDRLVFANRVDTRVHLIRHCLVDLFLDTVPYNAHTTTSDALRMGVPVLTCIRETFASRVAASLLTAMGVPELIVQTEAEYEERAVALANDPAQIAALKQKISDNFLTKPLFNADLFTHHLEELYLEMMKLHRAGMSPRVIMFNVVEDGSA